MIIKNVASCEICGKTGIPEVILEHEIECRERQEREIARQREAERKYAERLEQAKTMARDNKAAILLVKNGFDAEAHLVMRDCAKYQLWDCGTSCGWTEVYDTMMAEVKKVASSE